MRETRRAQHTHGVRIRLSIRDQDGFSRDVALEARTGTTLRDVGDDIMCVLSRRAENAPDMWSGTRRLPATAMLGGPGLRNGDTITLGGAGERDLVAGSVLRLQVVGGPDAGTILPLPRGILTVGRAPGCDLRLTDPDVSRQHAAITVTAVGISARDLGSTNGTALDGVTVDADGSSVLPGQLLRLGDSLLCISAADEPAAATRPADDGALLVNRPPRLSALLPDREVSFPVQLPLMAPQRMQWLAAVIPAVVGCVLALSMHNLEFLAFALLSPVMMIAVSAGDQLHWRRDRRRESMSLRRRERAAGQERDRMLAAEITHRRRAHPDPAALLRTATIPDCRLWERRRCDLDLLHVRLGLGDQPARLRMRRGADVASAGTVPLVPVTVGLRDGPLGLAGPRAIVGGTARWIAAQLALLHSPSDVRQILLLSDDAAATWTWARWLPHVGGRVACTAEERTAVVADVRRLIDERLTEAGGDRSAWTGPWLVLVVDRAGELAELLGLAHILATGPRVGVTAVCVDDDERRLPTACAAVASVQGETGTRLSIAVAHATAAREVIADRVSTKWAERAARSLAALKDGNADANAVPDNCRLLDLLGLDDITPDAIAATWKAGAAPRTEIGATATGAFRLDLVRDGPHTLIAGTTGSGKSEMLQSLVAGLAVRNSPEAMTFVLIDYKGGAAFADCARLPHCAGLVTDLDPHLTQRALQSLEAELQRREALLARAGANDLDVYLRCAHDAAEPLGRLMLIVDEFAALVEELPDFITGLVGIAQRGRSLGVHLVLATQRPGGVISPEIRANTTLRIALRVTDPAESSDVIGAVAAATIDKHRPGRAYVRAGSALTEIQTARVSAPVATPSEVTVTALDAWGRPRAGIEPDTDGKTDLQLLVDAVCEAAVRIGARRPRRAWLPPLPDLLPATDLATPAATTTVPFGMIDLPNQQHQETLTLDLEAGGAVLFAGGARSGRSTVLRSLAISASQRLSPEDMHLYVIDCAGGSLRSLGELAHCGAVTTRDEFGTVQRLLGRLSAEIGRRQTVLAQHCLSSSAEARAQSMRLPMLLLLLDGWDGFVAAADEEDAGSSVEDLLGLLRESAAAGLTVALSGDRSTLAARLASVVSRKYVLRLADSADYVLAGIPTRAVPQSMPPGRAIHARSGQVVQLAFAGQAPSAAEHARVIAAVAQATSPASPGCEPFRIRALPSRVRLSDLQSPVDTALMVLGSGGDAADAVAVDMYGSDARLLVAGPPRSGRTTTLHLLMEQAVARDIDVLVAAPRRSPLRHAAASHRVALVVPEDHEIPSWEGSRRRLLLVDDTEAFIDSPAGDALSALVRSDLPGLAAAVAARNDELAVTYRGIAHEVRRSRAGLLLQPGPGDGDLLGVRIARRRSAPIPGRGILVLDATQLPDAGRNGEPLPIQVALPSTPYDEPRARGVSPCVDSDNRTAERRSP